MESLHAFVLKKSAFVCVFTCLCASAANASCSFDWEGATPTAFENVGYDCNLVISVPLGDTRISDGSVVRFLANFDSMKKTASQTLGYGWHLNLTDISVVPSGQNTYTAIFPGGWRTTLYGSGNIYKNGGWILEVKNEKMILSRRCGMVFIFRKGVLHQYKNSAGIVLDYKYDRDGKVVQINDNGRPLAKFDYDNAKNSASILLHDSERPIKLSFQDTGKKALGKTLGGITTAGGDSISFEFKSQNGSVEMTTTRNGSFQNSYVWNLKSGILEREYFINDGRKDYYSYSPGADANAVDIRRSRASGGSSELTHTSGKGIETRTSPDGSTTTVYYIPYGVAANKVRRKTVKFHDGTERETLFNYDEKGRLIREMENRKPLYYIKYDDKNRKVSFSSGDGSRKWDKFYDEKGRLATYRTNEGKSISLTYANDGSVKAVMDDNGKKASRIFSADEFFNLNLEMTKESYKNEE